MEAAQLEPLKTYEVLLDGRISLQDFFELFLASADLDISIFLQLCQRQKNRRASNC